MTAPKVPRERERLIALRSYEILDTPPEPDFDDIVSLVAEVCHAPIAALNFIDADRQWFKAEIGLGVREMPLDNSICAYAILEQDLLVVPDTRLDRRFAGNPLVTGEPHLRFYAGALLTTPEGHPVGTLCVLDFAPRALSAEQMATLRVLARQVITKLELRRALRLRDRALEAQRQTDERLRAALKASHRANEALQGTQERFAAVVHQDVIGVAETDETGRFLLVNEHYCRMVGRPEEELLAMRMQDISHPEDLPRNLALFDRLLRDGTPYVIEKRYLRPDGSVIWVENHVSISMSVAGRPRWIVALSHDVTSRKRSEDALREAEQRLRATVERAPVGIAEVDLNGRYLRANDRFCAIRRMSRKALVASDFISVTHPNDRGPDIEAWEKLKAGEISFYSVEKRFRGGDGQWYWALVNCSLVRDAKGEPLYAIRVAEDITEQKRAAERLRESELRLKLAQEAGQIGLWDWDLESGTMLCSDGYCRIWGIDPRSSVQSFEAALDRMHPADRDGAREDVRRAIEGAAPGYESEFRVIGDDGATRWIVARGQVFRDTGGKPVQMIGACYDVTRRKETEEALQRLTETLEERVQQRTGELTQANEELLAQIDERQRAEASARQEQSFSRLLVESTTEAIVAVDAELRHTVWNRGVEAMTGLPRERVLGRTVSDVFPQIAGSPVEAAWRAALQGETAAVNERAYVVEETGRSGFYGGSFAPIRGAGGAIIGAIAFLHDTTERHRMEEAVRQAQRLDAIGQLTGGVAHDFNNLLTVIGGNLELLKGRWGEPERAISTMERAIARGQSLTRQLLSFSRRQALQPRVVDLHARTAGLIDLLRPSLRGDIELAVEVPPSVWPIEVDPGELELALINVAVNARDAMPKGGMLRIRVENRRLDRGTAPSAGLVGDYVEITASDTGTGIPDRLIDKVFEPFFTTKEIGKGTGLGLSQVYGFASQSGGTAAIASTEGRGTTVSLYLPRAKSTLLPPELEAAAHVVRPASGEILLVEDNDEVAEVTTILLQSMGYGVKRLATAAQALDWLAAGQRSDLVITDIVMPGGTDGIELARSMRALYPSLPVLLITGYSGAAAEAGREGLTILPKPYQRHALEAAIREVMQTPISAAAEED